MCRGIFDGRMIVINQKETDAEGLYQEYLSYQRGDKSALDRVFVETDDRLEELTNKYYSSSDESEFREELMDNVLDAEFIKADILDEQKKHHEKIKYRFTCLNQMLNKAKYEYSNKSINTGYGDSMCRTNGYKKFHNGEYDISDIQEIMTEIIIMVFQGKLKSKIPITDSATLLGNIKYHLMKEVGRINDSIYKNIPELKFDMTCNGEETYRSYFDEYAEKKWMDSQGEVDRLLVYSDFLKWIINNDIHKLFKKDSYDIHVIIDAILKYKHMFKQKNQEGLTKDTYKDLQEYIWQTTGKIIADNNISMDLKLIEQKLLNHLLYALNYEIGKAEKSCDDSFGKESRRWLKELIPKRYFKLFGRESMSIYSLCTVFLERIDQYSYKCFLYLLEEYEDVVIPILEKEKGQKKYDMVNLLTYDTDVVAEDHYIVSINIADTLIAHYQKIEEEYLQSLLEQYSIVDRFKDGKSKYWQANFNEKKNRLIMKFLSSEDIKKPVSIKIKKKDLILYEGYSNFYFCNTGNMCCYCVPKNRRIIRKSDKNHKIFCYKSA